MEMMNSESSSINEGNMYYDLKFRARVPGGDGDIFLIVNMEIQNQDNPKYALVTRGDILLCKDALRAVWDRVQEYGLP